MYYHSIIGTWKRARVTLKTRNREWRIWSHVGALREHCFILHNRNFSCCLKNHRFLMLTLRAHHLSNTALTRTEITPQSLTKIDTVIVTFFPWESSDFPQPRFQGVFLDTSPCVRNFTFMKILLDHRISLSNPPLN